MEEIKVKNMTRAGWANKVKRRTWGLILFAVIREMFIFLSLFVFSFQIHLYLKLDKMFDYIHFLDYKCGKGVPW